MKTKYRVKLTGKSEVISQLNTDITEGFKQSFYGRIFKPTLFWLLLDKDFINDLAEDELLGYRYTDNPAEIEIDFIWEDGDFTEQMETLCYKYGINVSVYQENLSVVIAGGQLIEYKALTAEEDKHYNSLLDKIKSRLDAQEDYPISVS